ncbi:single-stranded DNA-binding protein [Flavobacterium collinsii]|nr:single-stranded DNA-binding protein [Flavobacterium collinsii]
MEITGRIVKDASVFKVKQNREVVNFSIAVNDSYKPKDGTELKKIATYIKCSYWLSAKKEKLKSFIEDLQNAGCISGMISEFIYHTDCKKFYIKHLDDLENIREELEDSLGEPVKNRHRLPHYTFLCWLCSEEYCFDLYRSNFE